MPNFTTPTTLPPPILLNNIPHLWLPLPKPQSEPEPSPSAPLTDALAEYIASPATQHSFQSSLRGRRNATTPHSKSFNPDEEQPLFELDQRRKVGRPLTLEELEVLPLPARGRVRSWVERVREGVGRAVRRWRR